MFSFLYLRASASLPLLYNSARFFQECNFGLPRSQLPLKLLVSEHPVTVDPRQLEKIMMIILMMIFMEIMMMIMMETCILMMMVTMMMAMYDSMTRMTV